MKIKEKIYRLFFEPKDKREDREFRDWKRGLKGKDLEKYRKDAKIKGALISDKISASERLGKDPAKITEEDLEVYFEIKREERNYILQRQKEEREERKEQQKIDKMMKREERKIERLERAKERALERREEKEIRKFERLADKEL